MEARLVDLGPLPDKPLIWDAGAYEGNWSRDILARYPTADLHLFEPVPDYAERLRQQGFQVHQYGLSDQDGSAEITVAGDRSSTYEMGYQGIGRVSIALRDVARKVAYSTVDVLKLNVEGAEYPILERLLAHSRMGQIGTMLVQFHTFIPNFGERYLAIRNALLKTHNLAWRDPFVWERWDLRTT